MLICTVCDGVFIKLPVAFLVTKLSRACVTKQSFSVLVVHVKATVLLSGAE